MKETISMIADGAGPLLLVGEYHGNPGSLIFYGADGREVISMRISVTSLCRLQKELLPEVDPVITGHADFAPLLSKILSLKLVDEPSSPLVMEISNEHLNFLYDNKQLIRFNIKSIR